MIPILERITPEEVEIFPEDLEELTAEVLKICVHRVNKRTGPYAKVENPEDLCCLECDRKGIYMVNGHEVECERYLPLSKRLEEVGK